MLVIKKITINYQKNPVGVMDVPQFGWVLESDKKNVLQRTYQLQIAMDEQFEEMIYDSSEVKSRESAHVIPADLALHSARKYYARVKVQAEDGDETSWSETAYFITALLDNDPWMAKFISAETKEDGDNSKGTYVRGEFEVKGSVKEAYAFTTALGVYEFYLNGHRVGNDELAPGWTTYHKHLMYQMHEVTDFLEKGNNAAGAMVGAGWYKGLMGFEHFRNNYGKQTAFLGQLLIRYADGSEEIISTDEGWKGYDAPITFAEIYDGEIYDANLELPGWDRAGYDDSFWRTIEVLPYDMEVLSPQSGSKVTEIEPIAVKELFKTPQGDIVLDFGQNMAGWVHVNCQGKAGARIELNCFEVLDADGNAYFDNLRRAKQTMTYICKDDQPVDYHPSFTFMGFRYARVASFPGEPKAENFTAYAVHSNMERTGFFECSNPDVNQLQSNILWGLKSNFVDVPTDCPQRDERVGWTGDAQIFCRTATYLMNTYTFFEKWLKDVAHDQTPEGGIPHVVPDICTGKSEGNWLLSQGTHSAAAWADVAVIAPWVLYQTFGDLEILKRQYKSMKGWIDFMVDNSEDYIWNYMLQFGDWVALDAEEGSYFGATPNDLTCTAYFAYSTGLFAKMAKALGKREDESHYQELYQKIVDKFQRTFFREDGTMTAQTQTAHIVALYFNLVPDAYRQTTVDGLLKLLEKENGHLVTGFVGTPYFSHALSQNGCVKEAYDLLLKDDFPSWLYQVKMGATTIWEHWDGLKPDGTMWSPGMNSFNHYAYGAIGEWLYRVAGGLEVDESEPGYRHSIIYPRIGGDLDYVKAEYHSMYGTVASFWECDGDQVTLKVTIPVNTTAEIRLDEAKQVMDEGGLDFGEKEGILCAQAGSGSYVIKFNK